MGTKRIGLARVQKLIEGLKRELTMGGTTLMGGLRKFQTKTANYTCTAADSGTTILVNPGGTTLIQLPGVTEVGTGWNVTIVIDEQDGGTMDQKVNIGTKSGEYFNGFLIASDGGGSVKADPSSNDFITCSTASTCGEVFNIVNDGAYMHVTGNIVDASDTTFADAAG
jgi:hypothetical protein